MKPAKPSNFEKILRTQPKKRSGETFVAFYARLCHWAKPIQRELDERIEASLKKLEKVDGDVFTILPKAVNAKYRPHVEALQATWAESRLLDRLLSAWSADKPNQTMQAIIDNDAANLVTPRGGLNPYEAMELAFAALHHGAPMPAPIANWLIGGFTKYLSPDATKPTLDECLGLTGTPGNDTPTEATRNARRAHGRASWMALLIAHGATAKMAAELVLAREKAMREAMPRAHEGDPKLPSVETLTRKWGSDWKKRYPHQKSDFVNVPKLVPFASSDVFSESAFGWPETWLNVARAEGLTI